MPVPLSEAEVALVDALAARSSSENLPLLLEVARRKAARRRPKDLVDQWTRDAFVAPSVLDQRTANKLDALALEVASAFEALLLSPLAPFGCCAAVSPTTQDRAVVTVRGTEVVSDPTNVLALECAKRLRTADRVRLCTVHQVVRPQRFPKNPGFSQHFRLFALAEAGFAASHHAFEVEAIVSHVELFLRLFDAASALGCTFPDRRVTLLAAEDARPLADRLLGRLATLAVALDQAPLSSSYYDGVRVLVSARGRHGERVQLGDTGLFDWMAKLTSNRRARFVASGIGIQLFPLLFRS